MTTFSVINMRAISVENLSFSFGSNQILKDICIEIDFKQIYALLGPSGGGKTTLLRLILGTIRPQEGSIRVMDEEPGLLANGAVSYMPQDCALFPYFSINQTMNYFKNIYRLPEKEFQKRSESIKKINYLDNSIFNIGTKL